MPSRQPFYHLTLNPMTNNITPKQRVANEQNAKLGGVKTERGKSIVRFNARKHGILAELITDYEKDIYKQYLDQLFEELQPKTCIEEMLVERIALCYLRLYRTGRAECEYVQSWLNPHIEGDIVGISFTEVKRKGYIPILSHKTVDDLSRTYLRYETGIENRLYKAMHELERLQRMRSGEVIHAAMVIDVQNENGFVSQNDQ